MRQITYNEAEILINKIGEDLKLHSTFAHTEGVSPLSRYWTEIETTYFKDVLLFKIVTIQETKDSEPYTKYYVGLNNDHINEMIEGQE